MSSAPKSHLVFACGDRWFALPAEESAEVVGLPPLTLVPGGRAHLLGVFNHRGELIPVVDLGQLTAQHTGQTRQAIVVRLAEGVFGLTTNGVAGVFPVEGSLTPMSSEAPARHFLGPVQVGAREVAVIETHGLWDYLAGQGGGA